VGRAKIFSTNQVDKLLLVIGGYMSGYIFNFNRGFGVDWKMSDPTIKRIKTDFGNVIGMTDEKTIRKPYVFFY
jgi:hypothetical protein